MAINDTSISVSVWDAVKAKLVAAAPTVSNLSTSATTAASIRAAYNDTEPARPQIILNPAIIDEADWKFGGTQGKKIINVLVECYADKSSYVDQLWDQVRAALVIDDIDGVDLRAIASDYAFSSPGDQKFHMKSGTFTYERE